MAKQVRILSRKQPACGPVDVSLLWKRFEVYLGKHAPRLAGNFSRAAKVKDIKAFEKKSGQPLPDELRQSFLIHNGQGRTDEDMPAPVIASIDFFSMQRCLESWSGWRGLDEDQDLNDPDLMSSTPRNAIQLRYCHTGWIPLSDIYNKTNYLGVDLAPGPKGFPGQVITFGRDEDDKFVLAWSWGWFLHDLIAELEQGNFRETEDEDGGRGLTMIQPAWAHDTFSNNGKRDWAKAKNAGRRPFNPHADLSGLRNSTVLKVARCIQKGKTFEDLPILGDALEDAGCTDAEVLRHCREPGEHDSGCWLVERLLEE